MSKFEESQMTSLNKNEMSRDEYLYIKYKTKYLNLKRELEGGAILPKSASFSTANSLLKGTKSALGKAASAASSAASATSAAASSAASSTIKGIKSSIAQNERLSKMVLKKDEAKELKMEANKIKDEARKKERSKEIKQANDKTNKYNKTTDEFIDLQTKLIKNFEEIKKQNMSDFFSNEENIKKLETFLSDIKKIKAYDITNNIKSCLSDRSSLENFTYIKNYIQESGEKLTECKNIKI